MDNRVGAELLTGSLQLRVKLTGTGLEKAVAARVLVKEARDDRGTQLTKEGGEDPPDFMGREYNNGMVNISLGSPARAASSVRMKGVVELYVPGRDPNAKVKIDKALAKLDAPLSNKTLKSAKIEITPLSPAAYSAKVKDRKLDEAEIAKIRAEGVARGVSQKEIDLMIGLAQALESTDTPPAEGTVLLSGQKSDFDRIFSVEILGTDGQPIDIPERSSSTRGDDTLMTLVPRSPIPANAALQLALLTDKSRLTFPFELTIELP
ncbi:MAG: hypothetical protein ABI779_06130 [Acidobacteriota bacterium]